MNGLIIINNAILSNLYIEVAKYLQSKGHKIYIVTDSIFTLTKYKLRENKFDAVFVFEEYSYSQHLENTGQHDSWNIHSDFDRNRYYKSVRGEGSYWSKVSNALYDFFESIYKENEIDFIFYENVSNGLAETALRAGKKYSVQYLGLTSSRLPGQMLFSDDEVELASCVKKLTDNLDLSSLSKEEDSYIESYLKNIDTIQPDYMKTNGLSSINFFKRVFKKRDFREALTSVVYGLKGGNTFQMGNTLLKSYYFNKREIVRTFCAKWLKSKYADPLGTDNYYIYPLHYHPESSTSILAKFYDEYEVIKNIAFSLPNNSFLYVKDHISANGYEGFGFYKKLLNLPNVKLISPQVNTKGLIRSCSGVFTLTSTVGYEGVLLNKPVVVFGDVFYNEHPFVYKISGYRDIKKAFDFMNSIDIDKFNNINKKFVAAYYRLTFPLQVDYRVSGSVLFDKAKEIGLIIEHKLNSQY
ncbi:capsular polysaccharide export protein, LipB/KpsS family [Enterobacter cloacae]|uniref:capsular polysaccharide export protein, LipB/KpsS family n=1 Tax=Enterobacter cloacae TaxID=550 RepID=UPI000735C332|nr:hypothetical protein [Enterobacter cloacae]KTH74898.1 hypothetical protein ASV19_00685 [Enterobacter cloacae subsp. cloacae]MDE7636329.1 capsular biosynthesis protein [Enterobacter cloacae]MDR9912085.1 hypothetical protein [Enterobacter cloacae subsp. cloacae]HAS1234181.1 hypothetical protein [Enterobacter cloacae]HAS1239161.1 hypothetical protein [Enterobacter cloacae]